MWGKGGTFVSTYFVNYSRVLVVQCSRGGGVGKGRGLNVQWRKVGGGVMNICGTR